MFNNTKMQNFPTMEKNVNLYTQSFKVTVKQLPQHISLA